MGLAAWARRAGLKCGGIDTGVGPTIEVGAIEAGVKGGADGSGWYWAAGEVEADVVGAAGVLRPPPFVDGVEAPLVAMEGGWE